MRTAIVSDLHLGSAFGEDVAARRGGPARRCSRRSGRRPARPAGRRVRAARKAAGGGARGRPALPRRRRGGDGGPPRGAGARQPRSPPRRAAAGGPGARRPAARARAPRAPQADSARTIAAWLGEAALDIAYPGVWLRDDVYATHGHYMDCHMSLPRLECIAAAVVMRAFGPSRTRRRRSTTSGSCGRSMGSPTRSPSRSWRSGRAAPPSAPGERSRAATAAAAGPGAPCAAPRSGPRSRRPSGESTASCTRISTRSSRRRRSPPAASTPPELSERLGVGAGHVITGHTHRGGPGEEDGDWPLRSGGSLHNTGSWIFASAFHHPGTPPGPYWPGTVTWIEDEGPPRRVPLLAEARGGPGRGRAAPANAGLSRAHAATRR